MGGSNLVIKNCGFQRVVSHLKRTTNIFICSHANSELSNPHRIDCPKFYISRLFSKYLNK